MSPLLRPFAVLALLFATVSVNALSNVQLSPPNPVANENVTVTWSADSGDTAPLTLALLNTDTGPAQTFSGALAVLNTVNPQAGTASFLWPQVVPGSYVLTFFDPSTASESASPSATPSAVASSPTFAVSAAPVASASASSTAARSSVSATAPPSASASASASKAQSSLSTAASSIRSLASSQVSSISSAASASSAGASTSASPSKGAAVGMHVPGGLIAGMLALVVAL